MLVPRQQFEDSSALWITLDAVIEAMRIIGVNICT